MSWHVVGPVMKLHLEATAKMVLLIYANESDDDGNSATAMETVGLKAGLSERTVQRIVKWFVELEVLHEWACEVGRGRARRFRLDLRKARALFGENPSYAQRQAIKKKGDSVSPFRGPGKGDTLSEKGDTLSQKGDTVSPTPVIDPVVDPAPDAAARADGAAPPGAEPANGEPEAPVTANGYWCSLEGRLRSAFGNDYDTWLKGLIALSWDGKSLTLGAPNLFWADKLNGAAGGQPSPRDRMAALLGHEVAVVKRSKDDINHAQRVARAKAEADVR